MLFLAVTIRLLSRLALRKFIWNNDSLSDALYIEMIIVAGFQRTRTCEREDSASDSRSELMFGQLFKA